jgi:hypothetical protein
MEAAMSSQKWTEVATGAEARSLRRWFSRAVVPLLIGYRWLLIAVLIGPAILLAVQLDNYHSLIRNAVD